jgi:hypothetical protein
MQQWDPRFCERTPMLEPYVRCASAFAACADWPVREALDGLLRSECVANARGIALRAVAPGGAGALSLSYEARVHERGELEVRERDWHDFFNVLAWCAFPAAKAALNVRHIAAATCEGRTANRGRARDALTLFDESGAIVVSTEPELLEDLREFRWKRLFGTERERVRAGLRVYLFGHALLEKALAPYVGMTAHAITLPVARDFLDDTAERQIARADAMAARHLESLASPQDLSPLPVLGVPGWWDANEAGTFYDNAAYFRPGRRRR